MGDRRGPVVRGRRRPGAHGRDAASRADRARRRPDALSERLDLTRRSAECDDQTCAISRRCGACRPARRVCRPARRACRLRGDGRRRPSAAVRAGSPAAGGVAGSGGGGGGGRGRRRRRRGAERRRRRDGRFGRGLLCCGRRDDRVLLRRLRPVLGTDFEVDARRRDPAVLVARGQRVRVHAALVAASVVLDRPGARDDRVGLRRPTRRRDPSASPRSLPRATIRGAAPGRIPPSTRRP